MNEVRRIELPILPELPVLNTSIVQNNGSHPKPCCSGKPETSSSTPLFSLEVIQPGASTVDHLETLNLAAKPPCCCTKAKPETSPDTNEKSCCSKKTIAPGITPGESKTESFFEKLLPFEKSIRESVNFKKWLGVNDSTSRTLKEIIMAFTNFTPAIGLAKLLAPLHISPYLITPSSLASMHLLNQGSGKLDKLGLNTISALGILSANQFLGLPRALVRPIMAFCVLAVETKWPLINSLIKLKVNGKDEKLKKALQHPEKFLKKDDFMRLLRLEALINTIPKVTKAYSKALNEYADSMGFVNKTISKLGIFALEVSGLSSGFVFGGKIIDTILEKLKLTRNSDYLSTRASTIMVLSCCPAEGSAEAIAEASAVAAT